MKAKTCDHCCTRIDGLTVRLGGATVLDKVNLHVNCSEVVGVVGPNGAGKTTLLRTMLGEVPYQGTISFRMSGRAAQHPKIGYVPQKLQFDLGSPISVTDLVASAISRVPVWAGVPMPLRERVRQVLARFSAEHLVDRRIGALSGGELQRVLLAIAMNPEPQLLLLDEPATGVDVQGLTLFYRLVDDLRNKFDIAVVLVTHDLEGVASYVDRLIFLNRSVVAEGDPREVLRDEKVRQIVGH